MACRRLGAVLPVYCPGALNFGGAGRFVNASTPPRGRRALGRSVVCRHELYPAAVVMSSKLSTVGRFSFVNAIRDMSRSIAARLGMNRSRLVVRTRFRPTVDGLRLVELSSARRFPPTLVGVARRGVRRVAGKKVAQSSAKVRGRDSKALIMLDGKARRTDDARP